MDCGRKLIKNPLVLHGLLNEDPSIWEIQNQGSGSHIKVSSNQVLEQLFDIGGGLRKVSAARSLQLSTCGASSETGRPIENDSHPGVDRI